MLEELNQTNVLNHADQGLNSRYINPDEKAAYEASLKIARDNYSHDETVRKEAEFKGILKGRLEEKREFATKLIAKGFSIEEIAELTDLPKEEVERLQKKHQ